MSASTALLKVSIMSGLQLAEPWFWHISFACNKHHLPGACGKSMSSCPINTHSSRPVSGSWTRSFTPTLMSCADLFFLHSAVKFNLSVQQWLRVPRCYQSDLVTDVWCVLLVIRPVQYFLITVLCMTRHDKHIRSIPSATLAVPKSKWSFERRSCGPSHETPEGVRRKSER